MRASPVLLTPLLLAVACGGVATPGAQLLFDGVHLQDLESISFGGEGVVAVDGDAIQLGMGSPLTGVRWTGAPLPGNDYEIECEATRVRGGDFFCGMTFPVGDSHCTLILGGWGGALVGLSCLDGADASDNETTTHWSFVNGRAYRIRLRVTTAQIRVWIDDAPVIDADLGGRRVSLRGDVALTAPFAITTYSTEARIRNLRLRRLRGD